MLHDSWGIIYLVLVEISYQFSVSEPVLVSQQNLGGMV